MQVGITQISKRDVFISHAAEDKEAIAIPLRDFLVERGFSVWLDRYEIKVGDSLSTMINSGLMAAQFGIVILSRSFFAINKEWPRRELAALLAQEKEPEHVVLLVWHGIDKEFLREKFACLTDRASASSTDGIEYVGEQLLEAICHYRRVPCPASIRLDTKGDCDPAALNLWLRKSISSNLRVQLIWPDCVRLGRTRLEECVRSLRPGTGNLSEGMRVGTTGCFLNHSEASTLLDGGQDLSRLIARIEDRLPLIVQGLSYYAKDWYSIHERTIRIFLRLAYSNVWRDVAYRLAMVQGKGIEPLEYVDRIKAATEDRREYITVRLDGISPVLCASVSSDDLLPQCCICLPKSLWMKLVEGDDWDIFLDTFLAPQLEMWLALRGAPYSIRYTTTPGSWVFNKFRNERGEEICLPRLKEVYSD